MLTPVYGAVRGGFWHLTRIRHGADVYRQGMRTITTGWRRHDFPAVSTADLELGVAINHFLPVKKGAFALELGSGTGNAVIASSRKDIVQSDVSPDLIQGLMYQKPDRVVPFPVSLDTPGKAFELVNPANTLMVSVLDVVHPKMAKACISSVATYLPPGGKLVNISALPVCAYGPLMGLKDQTEFHGLTMVPYWSHTLNGRDFGVKLFDAAGYKCLYESSTQNGQGLLRMFQDSSDYFWRCDFDNEEISEVMDPFSAMELAAVVERSVRHIRSTDVVPIYSLSYKGTHHPHMRQFMEEAGLVVTYDDEVFCRDESVVPRSQKTVFDMVTGMYAQVAEVVDKVESGDQ